MLMKDDFYYKVLNIRQDKMDLDRLLSNIVPKIRKDYPISNDAVGLCKVCASLVSEDLKEAGIEHIICNTHTLLGGYEHEFVLARGLVNEELCYYLIDMTFCQFLENGEYLRDFFHEWPANRLLKLNDDSNLFATNLLDNGFSRVDTQLLSAYLASFASDANSFSVEDIGKLFLDIRMKKF